MSDEEFPNMQKGDWHGVDADDVIARLHSDRHRGLSSQEVLRRLKRFGGNRLPSPRKRPAWLRFILQFHNALIYVMLVAAGTTAFLGDWVDTGVLLAAVFVNAIIGFIQEGKAEQSMDAIRNMLSLHTLVIRDAERIEIQAEDLVPGDIVVLASGDKVPADLRLVAGKGLRVNEAILTGESEAVEKTVVPVPVDAILGDRRCMLYSGTLVASGQADGGSDSDRRPYRTGAHQRDAGAGAGGDDPFGAPDSRIWPLAGTDHRADVCRHLCHRRTMAWTSS